ncbi:MULTISPECIES: protein translocase subunit SecF [Aestuariimicrobium]|uniref:protein translocase subunit SecF n=1 Tax=Aestuariimicrobium TaxID=396388 RepID=UPI0003B4EE42|nr:MULTISPECIES: protein translocase subunit SecF [Aestuariimicrobium]CAI9410077.1 Protein translocase subunit SecF [Aestuariimicrobium sp. T2.26MG-19.2B]
MADAEHKHHSFAHKLYTGEISYDFVGKRKVFYAISAALVIISLLGLGIRGLNLGIEFTGGSSFQVPTAQAASKIDRAREVVQNSGVPDLDSVTTVAVGDSQVRVQMRSLETAEVTTVRQALASEFKVKEVDIAYSLIGKSWGKQITQKGIIALVVFVGLVMLLIWGYFRDWKMSVAAIVALGHDLVLTVGAYALLGFAVTPATLIGVLTILGYSLYDTVVVFDKVRENVRGLRSGDRTYAEAANHAVNQVLVRSVNTTIIGVLPVAALLVGGLFFLGTGPLLDLGLALFVGMVAGAYSSIFIAAPLLAQMREAEPEMAEHRASLVRRRQRHREQADRPETTAAAALATTPNAGGGVRVQPSRSTRSHRKR